MNPNGRPTAYKPDFCEQARKFCLLGATNEELGELFSVTRRTVDNWLACHPEFAKAVGSGRLVADSKIADGLYTRAIGFERKVKRTALYRGEPKDYETNVYFPPDTQACIFWLRNRRRQTWRDGPNAATPDDGIDDIARLEAASESMRPRNGAAHAHAADAAAADARTAEESAPHERD